MGRELTKKIVFTESAPSSTGVTDHTLPVVFDATEDPSVNNLTRSDANCDKTGTCYDGKQFALFAMTPTFTNFFTISRCTLQGYPDSCPSSYEQTIQRTYLRSRTIGNM